ncbi:MAG: B12-binding domain-containing radical SAM protein [Fusobacterium sp.]|uniref:B12-binding domain-containing radical SAM protein n=1 Tax=Fusobacterium sp. TaxID=68766 RepID=UPI00294378D9|nr:B12-binding domain-containing radical SAM protein [Fusobacterium sp.]MDY3059354.1 B12-binding domain-containing radical SAM protein [Fusobacterium sp.]MEE1475911.1 B12-binding domain-containing radical SAM protein [Fusobacterium sp.]
MSKIVLAGINSQYVHLNLAVRYLKKYVEANSDLKIEIYETNINNQVFNIIKDIYELNPDKIIFSTYIWNKEYVVEIVRELKKVLPNVEIILGGPEVSYKWEKFMANMPEVDALLLGEGEKVILNFLTKKDKKALGVVYRENGEIIFNGIEPIIENLDIVPFPYEDWELEDRTKIFYYESSRGCPFSCSYCLSSIDKTVRYYSLDRMKKDLKRFLDSPIKLLKFVDRTFNLKKERYMEIWKFLLENYREGITFHFEINANIFDDETLDFLEKVPKGYFQFEIGVQSINPETMVAIKRNNILDKLAYNVRRISRNIHLHLDLIAGLPYETYDIFKDSFNYVYNLKPEMIQLGFLKLLKGTQMYDEVEKYNYKYYSKPPYEVFSNKFISFGELVKLKNLEKMLDYYYNSEKFSYTCDFVIKNNFDSAFTFFEKIADYYDKKGYLKISHKEVALFNILYDFYVENNLKDLDIFVEFLKYDYLALGKPGSYPEWLKSNKDSELHNQLIKDSEFKSVREGHKNSELEEFKYNIFTNKREDINIFFNYKTKKHEIIFK